MTLYCRFYFFRENEDYKKIPLVRNAMQIEIYFLKLKLMFENNYMYW